MTRYEHKRARRVTLAVAVPVVVLALTGCGSTHRVTVTHARAPAPTAATSPQARAACAALTGDVPAMEGANPLKGIGQFGKDTAALMPQVHGADQSTVFQAVADISHFLHDVATGKGPQSDANAVTRDVHRVGSMCATILHGP